MKNLITITQGNVHMFPLDIESELTIKAYLEDNMLNSLTRFQYAYNPENNKIYSRHLIKIPQEKIGKKSQVLNLKTINKNEKSIFSISHYGFSNSKL